MIVISHAFQKKESGAKELGMVDLSEYSVSEIRITDEKRLLVQGIVPLAAVCVPLR
jgi:hypothetical protein